MSVYLYACVYGMCVHVCICVHTCMCICVCMCVHVHICVWVYCLYGAHVLGLHISSHRPSRGFRQLLLHWFLHLSSCTRCASNFAAYPPLGHSPQPSTRLLLLLHAPYAIQVWSGCLLDFPLSAHFGPLLSGLLAPPPPPLVLHGRGSAVPASVGLHTTVTRVLGCQLFGHLFFILSLTMDLINCLQFGVLQLPWHPLVVSEFHHILKRKFDSRGNLSLFDDVIYPAKIGVYPWL